MEDITNKLRWGEIDEDDEDLSYLLPPKQVIGPDFNGYKKVIVYKFDNEGNKVKVTTTIRVRKLCNARLCKNASERRFWPKFGDAVNQDVKNGLTIVSSEEIKLDRHGSGDDSHGTKQEETKPADNLLGGKGGDGNIILCRTCGKFGDHWTVRCPYKDLAQPIESLSDKSPADGVATPTLGGNGAYVPPRLRGGAERSVTNLRRQNEENSIRITNLSEDTEEADLSELFRPFGHITRVYVGVDKHTGLSRGFGFVNFSNREDAERAINKLNGYGYDNLILRVEWATPRYTMM